MFLDTPNALRGLKGDSINYYQSFISKSSCIGKPPPLQKETQPQSKFCDTNKDNTLLELHFTDFEFYKSKNSKSKTKNKELRNIEVVPKSLPIKVA